MNADGTEQTNLTNDWEPDLYPTWAPDGSRIAFVCRRDGSDQICASDAAGTDPVQLTSVPVNHSQPDWSPNGSKIAFQGGGEVHSMNPDGTGQVSLSAGSFPTWSPDGARIAFLCRLDGNRDICAMNADGSSQVRLTHHPDLDMLPSWSPDGTQIVIERRQACGQFRYCSDLFLVNADGQGEVQLTHNSGDSRQSSKYPVWSPDLY